MSAPKPAVIVLILLLVTLVVLFVVFVGVGAVGGQREPDWEGLKNRFLKKPPAVTASEAKAGCDLKAFTGACKLEVPASDAFLRRLELSTLDIVQLAVQTDPKDAPILVKLRPSGGEPGKVSLSVRGKGATVQLRCVTFLPAPGHLGCRVDFGT